MGTPRARRPGPTGGSLTVSTIPTKLAGQQIKALRGKARASFVLAVEDIRQRGCAAAGVRLAGEALAGICWLDLYGAWRLLTVFEAPDRCVLLLVAEHTRTANPYRLLYTALGIDEPQEPRTKPSCCDDEGKPPIDPDLAGQFERGLRVLGRSPATSAKTSSRRRR
ncbi:MAG TPA: hypothetical protein VFW50_34480 [Streptosporangiaceae bacterium]|nr:hypothetical protein [Streptosporangiaceae bacterium]